MARDVGFAPVLMQAVEDRNQMQKRRLVGRIVESYGDDLTGLMFGMWGLAFKPGTDDVREASSAVMIRELVERGAIVKAYDPAAMRTIHEIDSDWIGTKLVLVTISMPRSRTPTRLFWLLSGTSSGSLILVPWSG